MYPLGFRQAEGLKLGIRIEVTHTITSKDWFTFCSQNRTLWKVNFKGEWLIHPGEEISRELAIKTVSGLILATFCQFYNGYQVEKA